MAGRHDSGEITHLAEGGTVSGTAEYVYDGNGNMTLDALKNISITYDINNLVSTVSRNDTILSNYTYLADGTKYKVMQGTESLGSSNSRSGRLYLGPMTYRFEPEGTVPSVTSDMFYLENVDSECGRVVVMDATGNILERNAYYPFGLQTDQENDFPNMSSTLPALYPRYINPSATRRDLYNGKEIQTIAGTDYLDYGFRQYDPVTARWMAVDPKAQKYLSMTPYSYCAGNPINFIDLLGDTLKLISNSKEDLSATLNIYNKGLGGYYRARADKEGYIFLERTKKKRQKTSESTRTSIRKRTRLYKNAWSCKYF